MVWFYLMLVLLPPMGLHGINNVQEELEAELASRKLYSSSEFTPAQGTSFEFVPNRSPPELAPDNPPSIAPPPLPPSPSFGSPSLVPQLPPRKALWCVAKPSAPAEQLQEAMDYACGGQGGADCEEIRPDGRCYYPDNLAAHASFAFNSYWQKNKRVGGTCSFDGAAMLVDSDPSSFLCQFMHT